MVRRGLTLFELVVAIALMLSIVAMVAPPVLRRLDERSFTAACDLLSQQMVLARAHAQFVGSGVEVVHDFDTRITRARRLIAAAADGGGWFDERGSRDDGDAGAGAGAIAEPWSERMLAGGLSITDVDPRDDENAFLRTSFEPVDRDSDPSAAQSLEPLRLAVFLPDGSALLGMPIWVTDDDGRIARLTTNPLTGLVTIERLDGTFAEEEQADEQTPESPDDRDEAGERGRDEPARERPENGPGASAGQPPGGSDPADTDGQEDDQEPPT